MNRPKAITCQELVDMIDEKHPFTLLDVREPEEFEICNIEGSILVPLRELDDHIRTVVSNAFLDTGKFFRV